MSMHYRQLPVFENNWKCIHQWNCPRFLQFQGTIPLPSAHQAYLDILRLPDKRQLHAIEGVQLPATPCTHEHIVLSPAVASQLLTNKYPPHEAVQAAAYCAWVWQRPAFEMVFHIPHRLHFGATTQDPVSVLVSGSFDTQSNLAEVRVREGYLHVPVARLIEARNRLLAAKELLPRPQWSGSNRCGSCPFSYICDEADAHHTTDLEVLRCL